MASDVPPPPAGPVHHPDGQHPDGRRRKGQHRRRQLLDATMRVIEHGGVAVVSQRAIAREAGLPPSAVTYYFPAVDDLLLAALIDCNDAWIRWLDLLGRRPAREIPGLLAEGIARYAADDRSRLFAEYELFLQAARRPELTSELDRWTGALDALVARFVPDPARRPGASAAIDGLLLRALAAPGPPRASELAATLSRLGG